MKRLIRQQLPLRGLTLTSAASGLPTNIRLDAVSVAVRPFGAEDLAPAPPANANGPVNPRPTLHLLIVSGDDQEAYKRTTKKTIKDWSSAAAARRGHEWLIVYVLPPTDANKVRKAFSLFTMGDRLRADWNSSKKERYAHRAPATPPC